MKVSDLFALPPPEPKPEHVEALERIRARDEAEFLLLDRLVGELLKADGEFTRGDVVDLWGLEDGSWAAHERYDLRMDERRRCYPRVQRYVDRAVARGELAKRTMTGGGWHKCYYSRTAKAIEAIEAFEDE